MLLTSGFPDGPHIHHFPGVDLDERRRRHGRGRIDRSAPVRAGDRLGLNLRFELGETTVPAGGHLRVVWLWPFDWAEPQADDPGAPDHVGASCSKPGVELRVTCAFRGDLVPWNHQIDVEVVSGELTRGDRVEVACREWRAPTFVAAEAELLFLINPEGGRRWIQLPPVAGFPVVAAAPAPLVWQTPRAWQELPGDGIRLAAFRFEQDDRRVETTVVMLGGAAGGVEANVVRWLDQLGVQLSGEELVQFLAAGERVSTRDGMPLTVYDFSRLAAPDGNSILAAVGPVLDQTLFVKMSGDGSLVAAARDDFMNLVASLGLAESGTS